MRTEEGLKKLLCGVSPHLHARIIKSAQEMESGLVFVVDKKASPEFIEKIIHEISVEKIIKNKFSYYEDEENVPTPISLEVTIEFIDESGYHIKVKRPGPTHDLEFVISELEKNQQDFEIIWDIKNVTEKFDFSLIEPKTIGYMCGVKFGNIFIKQFNLKCNNITEFFAYVVLRKFLGTKSPEVNIIKGEKYFWMESKNLSGSYEKNGTTKEKKFSMLREVFPETPERSLYPSYRTPIPDWIVQMTPTASRVDRILLVGTLQHFFSSNEDWKGLSESDDVGRDFLERVAKLDPSLDHTQFDQKSILRLMLLVTLLRANDLHVENAGAITSKDKLKLAVVDLQVDYEQENRLVDFSKIDSWERLSTALYLEFAHNAGGNAWDDPVFPVLSARAIQTNVRMLEKAIDSIFLPRTESESKNKTNPTSGDKHTLFQQRAETFVDAINDAHQEMRQMLIGAGVEGTELQSALEVVSVYKTVILSNYAKLNSAVELLKTRDLNLSSQCK